MNKMTMLCAALALGLSGGTALAQAEAAPRDAEAIVSEYQQIRPPQVDPARQNDPGYRVEYMAARQALLEQRNALAKELFEAHPDHPQALPMMQQRWMMMATTDFETMRRETRAYLDANPEAPGREGVELLRIQAGLVNAQRNPEQIPAVTAEVDRFIEANPGHEVAAPMLLALAEINPDPEQQVAGYQRVAEAFPNTDYGKMAADKIRTADAIGKPFELAFEDAITGERVAMEDLRGKVVMIDFWATWCGPCVAEMPELKALYAKYKDRGVEFIGVSLDQPADQGGLDALKAFVDEHDVPWPQYYQGKGWESEFSRGWGINAIPAQFIVDAEGNLRAMDARGRLEHWIERLLAEKAQKGEPAAAAH